MRSTQWSPVTARNQYVNVSSCLPRLPLRGALRSYMHTSPVTQCHPPRRQDVLTNSSINYGCVRFFARARHFCSSWSTAVGSSARREDYECYCTAGMARCADRGRRGETDKRLRSPEAQAPLWCHANQSIVITSD